MSKTTIENFVKAKLMEKDKETIVELYLQKCFDMETELSIKNKQLAELKQNAIVPKFKIGQEVWYYHIGRNKIYNGIVEDIQWRLINGMYYMIPNLQRNYFWIRDDELFATKEEAEARLKEIQNETTK